LFPTYKGTKIGVITYFLLENIEAETLFKVLKEKNSQCRIVQPVKVIFRNESKIKAF
jgi:hypothetical protein